MTYEAFKIALMSEVIQQAGEEVDVRFHKITKNNGVVMDAMTIMTKGSHVAPTLYLMEYYVRHQEGESVKRIASEAITLSLSNPIEKILPEGFFMTYESVKNRICYRLINYEKNADLLKEIPYKQYWDLAMVFYYAVDADILHHATVLIRNTDMERWNIPVDELMNDAMLNTPVISPWRFASIQHVIEDFMFEGMEEALTTIEKAREIIQMDEESVPMYILTNKERYYGAACILYPGLLASIADRFECDLYILPSSIHECIIMPVYEWYTKEGLSKMVREINEREVDDMEILADHAYLYERETEEIQL